MSWLLLLRHGQSTWNAEDRWQGWADPPLSPLGEAQARAAAEWLVGMASTSTGWAGQGFAAMVSSDLQRARRTATIIAEGLGTGPVTEEPGLRERNVGEWESLTRAEIQAGWPEEFQAWRSGHLSQPPGGEPRQAMADRVMRALMPLAARPDGPVLVVTHGGVIRLLERGLGLDTLTVGHLSGRWFEPDGDGLKAGEAVWLPDLDDQEVRALR